jgi:hypothetical protein
LENRTPEQVAEEEALYIEIKRLEQNERKFKKEREALLRTLAGMDSGLPDIVEDDGASLGITTDGKKRKKGAAMEIDSPTTPSTSMALVKRPSSAKNAAYGIFVLFLCCFMFNFFSKILNTVSFGRTFRLQRLLRRQHTNLLIFVHSNYQPQKLRLLPK